MRRLITFIDITGLLIMGMFSLLYCFFTSSFAELHIKFPFLKLPIFIGELLILACCILLLIKWRLNKIRFGRWVYFLIFYSIFVLAKASWGYWRWGPLALRHAALFYYPIFALFGYNFMRKDIFNNKTALLVLIIFSFICLRLTYLGGYFLITFFSVSFIFISLYPQKKTKVWFYLLLFILTPYRYFFETARTFLISNIVTLIYLLSMALIISKIKAVYKILLSTLVVIFIFLGSVRHVDTSDKISLLHFKGFTDRYNQNKNLILARKDNFVMKENGTVNIYNPNPVSNKKKAVVSVDTANRLAALAEKVVVSNEKQAVVGVSAPAPVVNPKVEVQNEKKAIVPVDTANRLAALAEKVVVSNEKQAVVGVSAPAPVVNPKVEVQNEEKAVVPVDTANRLAALAEKVVVSNEEQGVVELKVYTLAVAKVETQKVKKAIAPTDRAIVVLEEAVVPKEDLTVVSVPMVNDKMLTDTQETEIGYQDRALEVTTLNLKDKIFRNIRPKEEWRDLENSYNCSLFRIFIWEDILKEIISARHLLGFNFGKPFRSRNLEILGWGTGEWLRHGWIAMHNGYLDILYRTGVVGLFLILLLFTILFKMTRKAISSHSLNGILLCGILINWLVAANFLEILELPYTAIPFWSIFGITMAYFNRAINHKNIVSP